MGFLENFNSKKLAAFAAVVGSIMSSGADAVITVAGLVGALAAFTVPQAIADRGKVAAEAVIAGYEEGEEAEDEIDDEDDV